MKKVIIMGAAGRDFHNFNTVFKNNDQFKVIAFTAEQIPDIDDRNYPAELAGRLYPEGIPIYDESELWDLIKKNSVDLVVFSYSDVSHEYVMHRASIANAAGADFSVLGMKSTSIKSKKPVISVCAVRTGSGKSQTTRCISLILKEAGKKVGIVRHPMPYGDLVKQRVQRFATLEDLVKHDCTIEEMEEYEPHIRNGMIVYAGVDYGAILKEIEDEVDVILWDGGNNDLPFYKPDLHFVVADPLRVGDELRYYPGEANLIMADVVVINKMDSASEEQVEELIGNIRSVNPVADIIQAESPVTVENPEAIEGKRVLVVEDGPTLTHGGMKYGAGVVAAKHYKAKEIVDPRPYLVGLLKETFNDYPDIGDVLPAMGYGGEQIKDLETTIDNTDADTVIIGTPIDLNRLIDIDKPTTRIFYDLKVINEPCIEDILKKFKII
jgi:predicted GTPase